LVIPVVLDLQVEQGIGAPSLRSRHFEMPRVAIECIHPSRSRNACPSRIRFVTKLSQKGPLRSFLDEPIEFWREKSDGFLNVF